MHLPQQIDPSYRPTGDSPENSVISQFRPLSLINNSNVIQFLIPRMPDVCVDMSATRIAVEFQVLKEDNTAIKVPEGKYLSTINSQLDSLFSGISISINGEQIISASNNHLLSFFMKQLNYSAEYRKSVLNSGHYAESVAGTEGEPTGSSFQTLAGYVKDSAKVNVAGTLSHPFFQSPKFMPPDTEIGITLTQSPTNLYLITDVEDKVKVVILDCYLMVRLVRLEHNVQLSLKDSLSKSPYIYPFKHTVLKVFTLAKDTASFTIHNAFYGPLPSRVFAIQVPTTSYIGTLTSSPFSFKSNKLSEYRFIYNGISLPLEKFKFLMPGNATLLYEHVNNVLKINAHQITPSYTSDKFIKDGFFVAESLISDCSSSQNTQPFVQGSLSVELNFSEALTENVSLIVIGEFSRSYVSIEKSGSTRLLEQ